MEPSYKEIFICVNGPYFSKMVRQKRPHPAFYPQEWDCLGGLNSLRIGAQAQWGVSFSPRVVCIFIYLREGF
jgi:hypothetical protein